jgi:short-subunit dehydrogenase
MSDSPVIVVTGASSGIGAATARLFGRQGYRVVLAARRLERLEVLADEIRADQGEAFAVATDVTQLRQIQNLVGLSIDRYGQIDVLFNNAGLARAKPFEALEPESEIDLQLLVNLSGVIHTTRAVLPHMIERRRGHVINMSSIAGWMGTPNFSVYSASKFALRGFSESLRREIRKTGIHISTVYSGAVATEFAQQSGITRETIESGIKTPRALRLTTEEVARRVLRLVDHPRRSVIVPRSMRALTSLNVLFPDLFDRFVERRFMKLEGEK